MMLMMMTHSKTSSRTSRIQHPAIPAGCFFLVGVAIFGFEIELYGRKQQARKSAERW
jgi:hypothetical protein